MALLDRLIWQIETNLDKPLTLMVLADRCAVNVHHMCRAFQLATGLSIMAYVRARRLSEAARVIAGGEADLLQVALGAGYGSHEAFTRAFTAYTGTLPSVVKQARDLSNLTLMEPFEMKKDMIIDVARPEIRERGAFRVAGYGLTCRNHDISGIPGLWSRFNAWEAENERATAAYGVSFDHADGSDFRYLAGMEMAHVPEGMEAVDIPARHYAVFTHDGSIGDLPRTIYTIWNKALPDADLAPATAPEFERYDHRFDPVNGRGKVEIWIPLA
ncbi:AraC family transcriptional regulator [Roseibacterium sp. SDUM158016]|uniref:AraC family transcriptional regulator n=1 Tax=Roseicyclus sediminis TaxID=2980997 RepID=UPI0021D16D36|nr:AraC family transcriptional regulator [Roseibacterium sp. SDUM158016]MCU4653599.1 AraC family transcriptional regulator [Roseibacterium sp. SDUM158016]